MHCAFFFNRLDGCGDGPVGTYEVDNSINEIIVSSNPPGSAMVNGTKLQIRVHSEYLPILKTDDNNLHSNLTLFIPVHTHGGIDSDPYLDLFFARDASNVTWEKIDTVIPSQPGDPEDITYANFFLPTGSSTQAIRVQLRNGGGSQLTQPCYQPGTGTNDRVSF